MRVYVQDWAEGMSTASAPQGRLIYRPVPRWQKIISNPSRFKRSQVECCCKWFLL